MGYIGRSNQHLKEPSMATKADFTEAEWKTIVGTPPMVGLAVAMASPNGPFGVMKEMLSIGMELAHMVKGGSSNPLLNAIIDDVKARATKPEMPAGASSPAQAKAAALANIKAAAALIDQKAPGAEGVEFKKWLLALANRVAEASTEGGFLGIGGVKVSDAEKVALTEIAAALGVAA
jgi:hypothetical protein